MTPKLPLQLAKLSWTARLAALAGAMLLAAAVGWFGWTQVKGLAKRHINQAVAQLSRRLGTPVLVGQINVSPFGASLEDIRIGPEAQVVISRIDADINIKPFSQGFAEPDEIRIESVQVKMTEDRLKTMVAANAGDAASGETPSASAQRYVEKLFAAMPGRHLLVYGAQVTLLSASGEPTVEVRDLKVAIDKFLNQVIFRVASVKTAAGLNESHVYGRLELGLTASDYRFFIKSKAKADAPGHLWATSGSVQKDLNNIQFNIALHRRPNFLAVLLKDQPLELTRLRARLQVEMTRALSGWQFTAQMQSLGTTLRLPLVSSRELGPLFFELRANGSYQPSGRQLTVDAATLTLPSRANGAYGENALRFTSRLQASLSGDSPRSLALRGQITLPTTSCQAVLDAAPAGLLPAIEDFKLTGDTAATVELELQTRNLEASRVVLQDARFDCAVKEAPYAYTAERLNGPLEVERRLDSDGSSLTINLDKANASFAPFAAISKNAQLAFVSSEDAAFYMHKGIDAPALVYALRRDLSEGRVAAGGSTITMQTVKNLFLTPERTLTRKMQELFLAWHLERTLSKERILELYMNVAELGPGIFGIGQASEHFFGKPAFDLNLLESAYLATLLPSPKIRYRYFCKGDLTPNYRDLVYGLLKRMLSLGRISEGRYQQAVNTALRFNDEQRLAAKECLAPPAPPHAEPEAARPESAYLLHRPAGATTSE